MIGQCFSIDDPPPASEPTPPEGYRTSGPRGCQLLESIDPGHEPAHDGDGREAAVQFLYETRGVYEVRHQAVWEGTWSSGRLATIRATSARPGYEVEEIRSELHDGR